MSQNIVILGLTGGIATGKSTFCHCLKELLPGTVVFDSDACVGQLYSDQKILCQIREHFGEMAMTESGGVCKSYLRDRAFSNPSDKVFLENLFHPRVRQECLALRVESVTNPSSRLFVADVPLLFECEFDFGQSANLLVATSRETQINRLKNRSTWDDKTIQSVLESQIPIDTKLTLADVVFWNEGTMEMLRKQAQRFLKSHNLYPAAPVAQ